MEMLGQEGKRVAWATAGSGHGGRGRGRGETPDAGDLGRERVQNVRDV